MDAKHLADGSGKIPVIGKAKFEGQQVKARGGMFEHVFDGVEEAQAPDVVMQGHARVLFEDAAEMIRRKMNRGRNVLELQRGLDVRVEKGLYMLSLFGVRAECVARGLLVVCPPAMRSAQDFSQEVDDFLLDGQCVEGAPVCPQKLILHDLQIRVEYDVTALEWFPRVIFDIRVVDLDHFHQQGGCDDEDRGRIFALDEMGNVVRLTHVVEQDVIRVGKKRAMRVPPLIRPRPRQDDFKTLRDFAFIVMPGATIVEGMDQSASEQGTEARMRLWHVPLTRCTRRLFHGDPHAYQNNRHPNQARRV